MDSGGSSYLTAQPVPYPPDPSYPSSSHGSVNPQCIPEYEASPRFISMTTESEHAPPVPPLPLVPHDIPIMNSQPRVAVPNVRSWRVHTSLHISHLCDSNDHGTQSEKGPNHPNLSQFRSLRRIMTVFVLHMMRVLLFCLVHALTCERARAGLRAPWAYHHTILNPLRTSLLSLLLTQAHQPKIFLLTQPTMLQTKRASWIGPTT